MADNSATALVEALLDEDPSESTRRLASALACDPPLTLWAVCTAGATDGFEPGGVEDLAGWLTRNALKVLQWETAADTPSKAESTAESETFAARVTAALEVADLAGQLAAAQGQAAAEAAFLRGMLCEAHRWLTQVDDAPSAGEIALLPEWLTKPHDGAADWVNRAAEILSGRASPDETAPIDLEACRRRAAEATRRWLAPVAGVGNWLPKLTARLARLAELENRFQETLEAEKLEAMAEFAAGAGHEINNPLTVIAGRAQLFLREEKDPERRRALALMNVQAKRVYEMIADMMLFARPPKPEPEPIDLAALIDELIDELSPQAAVQETTLHRVGVEGPVEIEVDPTQLTVALRALCRNALEAIGREGEITIGVHLGRRHVEIRVADDGPGIPPDQRRHLFDPYYSARQAGRGLGLGLSKCWRIVTNHGGRIDVENRVEHGSVFIITLPYKAATGGRADGGRATGGRAADGRAATYRDA